MHDVVRSYSTLVENGENTLRRQSSTITTCAGHVHFRQTASPLKLNAVESRAEGLKLKDTFYLIFHE